MGFKHLSKRDELSILFKYSSTKWSQFIFYILLVCEFIIGIAVVIGAKTQYAVLLLMVYCLYFMFFTKGVEHKTVPSQIFFVLLFFVACSLFITGAGAFAVDLPI